MAKANTTPATQEVILTPQQLAAFRQAGIAVEDQDGNILGVLTPNSFTDSEDEALREAIDTAQQTLSFLTAVLGQNPGYLELEAPAVMGLHNVLDSINQGLSV